jgi:hypothetical protein
VETYADKLAIFSLLDQLSAAAALGDVKAVKFLRDKPDEVRSPESPANLFRA